MGLKSVKRYQTKQEWVCGELREAIRSCELKPGQRLILDDLAADFGVSRVPIREAILQLQTEGLVLVAPHSGATVAPVSCESASDYFAISRELQVLAVRAAVERMTAEEREELQGSVRRMEEAAAGEDLARYTACNHEFHGLVARLSHMPLLPHLLEEFQQHWRRIERYYGLHLMTRERMRETIGEHRRLVDAMIRGDADGAERASREHNVTGLADHLRRMAGKDGAPEGAKPKERKGNADQGRGQVHRRP